eukprot:GHVS01057707.1.p1 GENE.GHVS01057707.1~~GHVS01057707.1.p1  ORF type:complete len:121 (+),score=22.33 GHVS01057707.1:63-425(+)
MPLHEHILGHADSSTSRLGSRRSGRNGQQEAACVVVVGVAGVTQQWWLCGGVWCRVCASTTTCIYSCMLCMYIQPTPTPLSSTSSQLSATYTTPSSSPTMRKAENWTIPSYFSSTYKSTT